MHRIAFGFVLCFFAVATVPVARSQAAAEKATPDVLIFANGDQMTGKMERAVGGSVYFKSDMAGELVIPFSKVKELRSGSQFAVIRKSEPTRGLAATVGTVDIQSAAVTVNPVKGDVETVAAPDVGYIIDQASYDKAVGRRAGFLEGWTGLATAGLTLVRATQTGTTATAQVNLVRAIPIVSYLPPRNRTLINLSESYGSLSTPVVPQTTPASPNSVVLTSIFHTDLERDEYFNRRLYAFADTAFDHNFAQGLQLQQIYGGGVGWTPIQGSLQQLDLKADVHYGKQEFQIYQNNLNIFGSTFTESYHRTFPRKVVFTENGNYLTAWNHLDAYSANLSAALTFPVYKKIGVSLGAIDNYLNNVVAPSKKNSFQFVTGITYTLP